MAVFFKSPNLFFIIYSKFCRKIGHVWMLKAGNMAVKYPRRHCFQEHFVTSDCNYSVAYIDHAQFWQVCSPLSLSLSPPLSPLSLSHSLSLSFFLSLFLSLSLSLSISVSLICIGYGKSLNFTTFQSFVVQWWNLVSEWLSEIKLSLKSMNVTFNVSAKIGYQTNDIYVNMGSLSLSLSFSLSHTHTLPSPLSLKKWLNKSRKKDLFKGSNTVNRSQRSQKHYTVASLGYLIVFFLGQTSFLEKAGWDRREWKSRIFWPAAKLAVFSCWQTSGIYAASCVFQFLVIVLRMRL